MKIRTNTALLVAALLIVLTAGCKPKQEAPSTNAPAGAGGANIDQRRGNVQLQ